MKAFHENLVEEKNEQETTKLTLTFTNLVYKTVASLVSFHLFFCMHAKFLKNNPKLKPGKALPFLEMESHIPTACRCLFSSR